MIRAKTGEFKLDDYSLIIHPGLSLSEFRAGDIPIFDTHFVESSKYTTPFFSGTIDGVDASFAIEFESETLLSLRLSRNASDWMREKMSEEVARAKKTGDSARIPEIMSRWGKALGQAHIEEKMKNDQWLERVIGHTSPYEFDWGKIVSHENPYTGDATISIIFRRDRR